jgi:hypothetical protein
MATQTIIMPILVVTAIIVAAFLYAKTKSWAKVAYAGQIVFALVVFILITQLADIVMISITLLLGLGLLINGIIGLTGLK